MSGDRGNWNARTEIDALNNRVTALEKGKMDKYDTSFLPVSGANPDRLPVYGETQRRIGYGDILLHRDGDYAVVSVFKDDLQIEVIREHIEGQFSHCVRELGIAEAIDRAVLRDQVKTFEPLSEDMKRRGYK